MSRIWYKASNKEQFNKMYLQLLKKAGIKTMKMTMYEEDLDAFIKKAEINAIQIIDKAVVNHQPYIVVEIAQKGLSDMTVKELEMIAKGESI